MEATGDACQDGEEKEATGEVAVTKPGFLRLPLEMVQEIATQLPSDKDLCNMIETCKWLSFSVTPPGSGVWRDRFRQLYDNPPNDMSSEEVRKEYKFRSVVFEIGASFRHGEGERESLWLQCISTMLKESYNPARRSTATPAFSPNISFIERQTQEADFFFQTIFKPDDICYPPTVRFLAIQLTMTYFVLQLETSTREAPGDYCLGDIYDWRQMVLRDKIDLRRALHIRNFWSRHLTLPVEHSYHDSYVELGASRRPTAWTSKLDDVQPLGSLWIGYYSCLHPFDLRERQTCADLASHWDHVPVLALMLKSTSDPTIWPDLFNEYYPRNLSIDASNRRYYFGEQFIHNRPAKPGCLLRGFAEVYPQQGSIPGWRRICFIIFKSKNNYPPLLQEDDDSNDDDDEALKHSHEPWEPTDWDRDFRFAYGYQGVVVPGGKVMLGCWMDLMRGLERADCGPFIFWEVPKF